MLNPLNLQKMNVQMHHTVEHYHNHHNSSLHHMTYSLCSCINIYRDIYTYIIHAEESSEGFLLCFKSIVQVSLSVFSVELYFLLHYFSF